MTGDDDDRQLEARRGETFEHFETVDIRHVEVPTTDDRATGRRRQRAFHAERESHRLEAVGFEQAAKRFAHLGLVVQHRDERPGLIHWAKLTEPRLAGYYTLVTCHAEWQRADGK